MTKRLLVVLLVALLVLSACDNDKDSGKAAGEMLPDVDGYSTTDHTDLTNALDKWGSLVLGAAGSDLATKLNLIQTLVECTNEAVAIKIYEKDDAILDAGIAAAVNLDRLASWDTFVNCTISTVTTFDTASADWRPCTNYWQYKEGDVDYVMLYGATSGGLCQSLCDGMPGCPGVGPSK